MYHQKNYLTNLKKQSTRARPAPPGAGVVMWCASHEAPYLLQCVTVYCSALQCVAVRCRSLQCVAVCCSVLQCGAVRCSVLQCATVRCTMLQCVEVRLQCVAVCCSVLQCIAVCCSATGEGVIVWCTPHELRVYQIYRPSAVGVYSHTL